MKNKLFIIMAILAVFSLTACTSERISKNDDKISIITSNFPLYDFAKNICGDNADVLMLLPPESESHSFEPTANDIINLTNCDLFIYIGGSSDIWIDKIKNAADLSEEKTLIFSDMITAQNHSDKYDEHIWTSVTNAQEMCKRIYKKIVVADSKNAEIYKLNYENYLGELEKLHEEFSQITENSNKKTVIFGDRFPFTYFVNSYNLNYFSAFPSCDSESEPSAQVLAQLTEKIKSENINTVFYIEFSNEKVADVLCDATGAEKRLFHSCHNVTKEEFENKTGYIGLMKQNAENLREALK